MIGAIVIIYKPEMHLTCELISQISAQVDKVVLVDNSPVATNYLFLNSSIEYIHFPENVGIAAAQNAGLKFLINNNCEYALLLDQDSTIPKDLVFRLSSLLQASECMHHNVVAIGPQIRCSFSEKNVRSRLQKEVFSYEELVGVTQIIASGMMINLKLIDRVGYKAEELFIDGVDHEWCWRAQHNNLTVAIARNVEIVHRLGDQRSRFFGLTYKVGAPIRLYYQFRNILVLSRRSYVPTYWKVKCLVFIPIRFLLNSCLQKNKLQRFLYMLKGLWDGLLNRQGSYDDIWS